MTACVADWAALPADLLAAVFLQVLHRPGSTGTGTPLRPLLHQLLALSHTCRHWAAVAAELPLDVQLYAASHACRAWLARRQLCGLRLASCAEFAIEEAAETALLGRGRSPPGISEALAAAAEAASAQPLRAFRAARAVGWSGKAEELFPWVAAAAGHSLTFDGMLQELEGVTDWSTLQAGSRSPSRASRCTACPACVLRWRALRSAFRWLDSGPPAPGPPQLAPAIPCAGSPPQNMVPLCVARTRGGWRGASAGSNAPP